MLSLESTNIFPLTHVYLSSLIHQESWSNGLCFSNQEWEDNLITLLIIRGKITNSSWGIL